MFTVRWVKSALNELTNLWLAASSEDRARITQAVNAIDQDLAADPVNLGESRPGDRRIHFVAPLGVLYQVNEKTSLVRVQQVWQFS